MECPSKLTKKARSPIKTKSKSKLKVKTIENIFPIDVWDFINEIICPKIEEVISVDEFGSTGHNPAREGLLCTFYTYPRNAEKKIEAVLKKCAKIYGITYDIEDIEENEFNGNEFWSLAVWIDNEPVKTFANNFLNDFIKESFFTYILSVKEHPKKARAKTK